MRTAHLATETLAQRIGIPSDAAHILRRAQMTLHRWAELECGDSTPYSSFAIERDDATGKPRMHVYPHSGRSHSYAIPDREVGALKRIAATCQAHGLHYFHQTDPRGCALYVAREPLTDTNYSSRGIACCV